MRTKRHLVFLSILFLLRVSAQEYVPKLQVVTDYSKCFYGLKEKTGKTIWKTEFTELKEGSITDKRGSITDFFWIAEKNGFYGALNNDGKVIVPFEFSNITFSRPGWFVGIKKEGAALYAFSGEQQAAGAGLHDITPVRSGFIVTKSGKSGFLDLQFREVIPVSYTGIEPVLVDQHLEDQRPVPSTYLLKVFEGSNQGLYDVKRKKLLIPANYEFIEAHWANERCDESQAVFVAFRGDSRDMINSEGTVIDSPEKEEYPEFYHAPFDSCATKALTFCLVRKNTNYETGAYRVRVINLQTGERSGSFDEAYANGNRILCRSGITWSVLDEHLKELKHWTKWNASWHPAYTHFDEVIRQNHIPDWQKESGANLRNNQRVVIYSKPSKDQVYLNFGIYDYVLNKVVVPEYCRISELEFDGKAVYWAYKLSKEDQKHELDEMGPIYSQIDIYDDRLNLIKSFKVNGMPHFDIRKRDISEILFFREVNELYGMVNGKGEEIIPVRYKGYKDITLQNGYLDPKPLTYYLMEDKAGYRVFNCKGKEVISEPHQDFNSFETVIIASDWKQPYTIFARSGMKILDNVSSYFVAKTYASLTKCTYLKNNHYPDQNLVFFIRGDELYYLQGEILRLVDSETFQFTSAYLRLTSTIIVDRNGKLVNTKGSKLKSWRSECPQELNELPLEEAAKEQRTQIPKKSLTYTWQRMVGPATRDEYWEVRNLSGVKLNNGKFDYPFNSVSAAGKIYRVKGKYGLMREHFDEVLPPEYDYIYPTHGLYVAFQKTTGLWTCFTPEGKAAPDTYDVISLHTWKGGSRLVFKGGKAGVLSDSATYVVPLTDSAEFVRKYDLVKLLQLDKQDAFDLKTSYNLVSDAKPAEVYKQINNAQVWWYSYHYSTNNAIMRTNPADVEFLNNFGDLYFRSYEEIRKKEVVVTTPFYYTERIRSHSRSLSSYSDFSSYPQDRYSANNFKIAGGKLVPVTLKDLVPSPVTMKQLDELLIKELNEKQYFGRDCIDMDAKLARLKENFLLASNRLVFYWPDLPLFQVELYFNELKGILSPTIRKQVSEF